MLHSELMSEAKRCGASRSFPWTCFFSENRSHCTIQVGLGFVLRFHPFFKWTTLDTLTKPMAWRRRRSKRPPSFGRRTAAQMWRHSCHVPFMPHQLQWFRILKYFLMLSDGLGVFREHDLNVASWQVFCACHDWSWGHPSKNSLASIEMLPWLGIVVLMAEPY